MTRGELLSPAGDRESFLAALDGGADAVYLGLTAFSARNNAANFTLEELEPLIFRAHVLGAKVYVAANTLIKDGEKDEFLAKIAQVAELGADAVILHDLHLADEIRKISDIPLHLSTQAGVCNEWGAKEASRKGFSRVILARETEISEISEIAKIIETEVFVQGALCSSFSGHCLMSSFAGCNSANRGLCKQPCRKKYTLDGQTDYTISLADLSVGERVAELSDAGVSSFKIEGRMRSPEYVYAATAYYRAILDGKKGDLSALKRAYNRGDYTEGYAFGWNPSVRYPIENGHIGESVGKIVSVSRGESFVKSDYVPTNGNGFKVLFDGKELGGTSVFKPVKGGFYLKGNYKIGGDVRLTSYKAQRAKRTIPVDARVEFFAGKPCRVELSADGEMVEVFGETVWEARTESFDALKAATLFGKTGDLPFSLKNCDFHGKSGFLSAKSCNEWRRNAYLALAEKLAARTAEEARAKVVGKADKTLDIPRLDLSDSRTITITDSENCGEISDIKVVFPKDYSDEKAVSRLAEKRGEKAVLLYVPAFFNKKDEAIIEKLLPHFDGIYANFRGAADFAAEMNIPYVAGLGLGAFSSSDAEALYKDGASAVVLSNELSDRETYAVLRRFPHCYVHANGAIRLMELVYCPFGGDCRNCRGKDTSVLYDEGGRKFYLRRYKISRCRFELYNGSALSIPFDGNRLGENLVRSSDFSENTTKGHWKRPLPDAND